MATLDELYSYDKALEDAWRDILQRAFDSAGVPATAYIEQSDDVKNTPFVDIQLRDAVAHGSGRAPQRKVLPDQRLFYNVWTGHLVSRVTTLRGTNSNLQSLIIGEIRAQAAQFMDLFTSSNLPNHTLLDMQDAGLHRGVLVSHQLDWSEVFHMIQFAIRDESWAGV